MKKKKKTALELLESFEIEVDMLADTLEVSRQTVRRWFKDHIRKVNNWSLVPADEALTFLMEYLDGKYLIKLCDPYTVEEFKDKDLNSDDLANLIQACLDKLVFACKCFEDDELDDIEKEAAEHIYNINLIMY